jgi:hypothetical protein
MQIKIIGILLFFVASSTSAFSQKFKFGIHATPTINFVSTDMETAETGAALKFGFGGLIEYRFTDRYAISSGFEIMNTGGTLTAPGPNINDVTEEIEADYNVGFLQFPVGLRMRTREFGYLTYMAEFGLVPGFRTSDGATFTPDLQEDAKPETYVNFFNTLFRFGLGLEYSLGGESSLLVGLNYNRSLIDNIKAEDPRLTKEFDYRFDYVALTVGFLF